MPTGKRLEIVEGMAIVGLTSLSIIYGGKGKVRV
jgi:hypothetical protein